MIGKTIKSNIAPISTTLAEPSDDASSDES